MFEGLTSLFGGGLSAPSSAQSLGGSTGGVSIRSGSVIKGFSLPTLAILSATVIIGMAVWKKL